MKNTAGIWKVATITSKRSAKRATAVGTGSSMRRKKAARLKPTSVQSSKTQCQWCSGCGELCAQAFESARHRRRWFEVKCVAECSDRTPKGSSKLLCGRASSSCASHQFIVGVVLPYSTAQGNTCKMEAKSALQQKAIGGLWCSSKACPNDHHRTIESVSTQQMVGHSLTTLTDQSNVLCKIKLATVAWWPIKLSHNREIEPGPDQARTVGCQGSLQQHSDLHQELKPCGELSGCEFVHVLCASPAALLCGPRLCTRASRNNKDGKSSAEPQEQECKVSPTKP